MPSEILVDLGLPNGEGGYSDVLDQLLKFTLDDSFRMSASTLHRVASTFYDCAALKAKKQNPKTVKEFQEYFAKAVKEWGAEEVMQMTLSTDKDKKSKPVVDSNNDDDIDMDSDGDEEDEDGDE